MKAFVNFAKVGIGDVSVDLGGGNVGVTEERLDRAQVGAVHKEVGSKTVTQSMWSDMFGDAGVASVSLDDALNAARGETAIVARGGRDLEIFRIIKKEGGEAVVAKIEIIFNAISSGLVDEDRAILFTFAAYNKFATFKIDGIAI